MIAAGRWLRRWGISVASLGGGLLTLFVFRRGVPHVRWIVGYVLLTWLLVAVSVQVRDTLVASERRAARLVLTATEYTIQTLFHGILLFLIPAYWAAATPTSVNVAFVAVLGTLALLTTFDPWYAAIARRAAWARHVFFVVSIFGALNLALPLVGVAPLAALLLSAGCAVIALAPALQRTWRWSWADTIAATSVLGLAAAGVAAFGRAWIPPAPLFLARASLEWVDGAGEAAPRPSAIEAGDLHRRGLVAHTAIYAPAGLRQSVEHVWRREGRVLDVVRLAPVMGGREEGYRTFSRKTAFPENATGRWSVDVTTASGQLIGRLRFRVVP